MKKGRNAVVLLVMVQFLIVGIASALPIDDRNDRLPTNPSVPINPPAAAEEIDKNPASTSENREPRVNDSVVSPNNIQETFPVPEPFIPVLGTVLIVLFVIDRKKIVSGIGNYIKVQKK